MLASIRGSRSQKPQKQNSRKVKRLFTGFQTNFFDFSRNMARNGTEVAERSRNSCRKSRDRWPTVEKLFSDVSCNLENFWKKLMNRHVTVIGGHANVGRLSNKVFRTLQAIRRILKKVTERSGDRGRRSHDRWPTVKKRLLDVSSY